MKPGGRTERQILGDLGEEFVAQRLREVGYDVQLIGGNFPDYDLLASKEGVGAGIRVQVKTWGESINEKPLAKAHKLHLSDVFVLVRADDLLNLRPYVYLVSEIATAKRNRDTPLDFPFARDPGTKNPRTAGFWARADWLFCRPERHNAWHIVTPCLIEPLTTPPAKNAAKAGIQPAVRTQTRCEERNGIAAPKSGGMCDQAWCVIAELAFRLDRVPSGTEAAEFGLERGLNPGNVRTELSRWKKFHGKR